MRATRGAGRAVLWSALLLAGAPHLAMGQITDFSWAQLQATCDGTATQLRLQAFDVGNRPDLVGLHFYRRASGDCARVRLTETPVVRVPNASTVYIVHDPNATRGIADGYSIKAVDVNGIEVDAYQLYSVLNSTLHDIATCGDDFLGIETLEDLGWALYFYPCLGTCAEFLIVENFPPALRDLADTGATVRLYGTFHCGTIEGCLAQVASYEMASCTVSVQESSWGAAKRQYR